MKSSAIISDKTFQKSIFELTFVVVVAAAAAAGGGGSAGAFVQIRLN